MFSKVVQWTGANVLDMKFVNIAIQGLYGFKDLGEFYNTGSAIVNIKGVPSGIYEVIVRGRSTSAGKVIYLSGLFAVSGTCSCVLPVNVLKPAPCIRPRSINLAPNIVPG